MVFGECPLYKSFCDKQQLAQDAPLSQANIYFALSQQSQSTQHPALRVRIHPLHHPDLRLWYPILLSVSIAISLRIVPQAFSSSMNQMPRSPVLPVSSPLAASFPKSMMFIPFHYCSYSVIQDSFQQLQHMAWQRNVSICSRIMYISLSFLYWDNQPRSPFLWDLPRSYAGVQQSLCPPYSN